jgi:hypothetical protein
MFIEDALLLIAQVPETWCGRVGRTNADLARIHVILGEMRLKPVTIGAQRLKVVRRVVIVVAVKPAPNSRPALLPWQGCPACREWKATEKALVSRAPQRLA